MMYRLIVSGLLIALQCTEVTSSVEERNLVEYLFDRQNYNSLIRPVRNLSEKIPVYFEMALVQLITLDERKQIMKSNIWLRVIWTDYQLTWDAEQFGTVKDAQLRILPHKVWKPDIVLFNNADGRFEVSFKSNVLISSDGTVMWVPCSIYKSACTIDVKYFPFDEQTCEMIFGSWTYNGDEIEMKPYTPNFTQVDLSNYEKSGTWDVVDVPGNYSMVFDEKEGHMVTRATYKIKLRRKTLFYTVNLIMPCVLISCLTMVVFYLPATAGEKITMSVSILLALIVFLQVLVSNLIPPSSISLPLFAQYLLFTIIIDVCCILNTIIVLNWNWKTPRTHTMSPRLRTFFFTYLARILMMQRPNQSAGNENAAGDKTQHTAPHNHLDLSDLHHPNCSLARMSLRQRRKTLAASSSSPLRVSTELNKAVEAVRFVAVHLKNGNDFDEVIDDWQYVSLLFDRLLLYIYVAVTIAGTLAILMNAPHIFTTFDQALFKETNAHERICRESFSDPKEPAKIAELEPCLSDINYPIPKA